MRAFVLVVLSGCGGFGAELGVAEPGLREDGAAEGEEGDGDEVRERDVDVDACADLLTRCLRLGVSDDTALRAFDECVRGPRDGREGDEERDGDERDGDERDGDEEGGDERDGEGDGDPERPA